MLRVYIVEDEPFARDELKFLLEEAGQIDIIGEAESMHEALWGIQEKQPDAVFLDIHLSQGNGMTLAKQFANLKKQPLIVFITAYDSYAIEAFELNAADYLLKPIDETRLNETVQRLHKRTRPVKQPVSEEAQTSDSTPTLLVKDADRLIVLDQAEIVYIGTENRQAFVKTHEQRYEIDTLLYEIKEKLSSRFLQVHRGYIVNLKQVAEVEPWFNGAYTLRMKDNSKVPVSRSYVKTVKQTLGF